jgi:hypothetical protein
VADSDQYDIGTLSIADGEPIHLSPFAQIDYWEQSGAMPPQNGAVCFCEPSECCPSITWNDAAPQSSAKETFLGWPSFRLVAALFVALVFVLAVAFYWTGNRLTRPPKAGDASPNRASFDEPHDRLRWEEGLKRAFFAQAFASPLPNDKLRARVVSAAMQARLNIDDLLANIVALEDANRPVSTIAKMIERLLEDWETPPEPSDALPASKVQANEALELLNEYVSLFDEARAVVNSPDEPGIRDLRVHLESTAQRATLRWSNR